MKTYSKWTQLGWAFLAAFSVACGGVEETQPSLEPEDPGATTFETTEQELRPGGGGTSSMSCSGSGAWCFDGRDDHWDIDNGCSIICPNGGAACDNAYCGGPDGTILFPAICVCRRTGGIIF